MKPSTDSIVSLISRWFLRPGSEAAGWAALLELPAKVFAGEPDTLTYLIHTPFLADERLQNMPPIDPISVEFFEMYRNADAFLAHVNGPVFKEFVQQYGALFVGPGNPADPGDPMNQHPFTTVEFMTLQGGFSRPGIIPSAPGALASSRSKKRRP
jgi:quinol monooxygenase YgiN